MTFLITFIVLSIINVVFSTIRSILTIKGGKFIASITSGGYFAFYNIMLIYTVADFPMWQKCVITFVCNVFGVFIVKFAEERARKDKLWKVEFTVRKAFTENVRSTLETANIPNNYIENVGSYTIFNIYCATQKQSAFVKSLGEQYKAKFFVAESKNL